MNLVKVPNLDKVNKKGIYMQYTEGCYYHIFNRGAHKELIFFEEENYRYLITLFNKYSVQYGVTIAAYYCIPNHYHLILKQHEFGSISSFLKTVFNCLYTGDQ